MKTMDTNWHFLIVICCCFRRIHDTLLRVYGLATSAKLLTNFGSSAWISFWRLCILYFPLCLRKERSSRKKVCNAFSNTGICLSNIECSFAERKELFHFQFQAAPQLPRYFYMFLKEYKAPQPDWTQAGPSSAKEPGGLNWAKGMTHI